MSASVVGSSSPAPRPETAWPAHSTCTDAGIEGNYSRTFVHGFDDELGRHGHVLLVRHGHSSPEAAQQVLDTLNPRAVLRFAEGYLTGHDLDDGGWQSGMAANVALQVGYLLDRGHQRLAMALPAGGALLAEVRLRFAREVAESRGGAPLEVLAVPSRREAVAPAIEEFLAVHGAVSAIAAFDDDVAARTLVGLRDLGLAVPGDVAVIGFDDAPHGAFTTPALTTVRVDAETHGRVAARNALGLDRTGLAPRPGHVVVRESA
ncbi:substrate-binding domain-containing protein [Blastococcus sp. SYSU DS0619]